MSDFVWGILGTGGIAQAFAKDLNHLKGHRIGGVGSRSSENAEVFAKKFATKPFSNYESLVTDAEVDAIYVATPHPMHKENVILALNSKKAVLCEKPFSVNAKQAQEMVECARNNGVALMEAMWSRFLPHYAQIREIVTSGILGQILTVHADHGQRLADQNIPRLIEPNLAGGALLDLGIYPVSFAHMILGNPTNITARAVLTEKGVDAQCSMIFDYASGAQSILNTTMIQQTPCRAIVSGLNGWLEIDRVFYTPTNMRVKLFNGNLIEYPNSYSGHGLREQAQHFKEIVQSGKQESELLGWADSVDIMKTLDQVRSQIGLSYPFESTF